MPRLGMNATSSSGAQDTAGEVLDGASAGQEAAAFLDALQADQDLGKTAPSRTSFEANALIPRTITDNVSPRTRSRFKEPDQQRSVSNYSRRTHCAERNRVFERASMARNRSLSRLRDPGMRDGNVGDLNEALRDVDGDPRQLPEPLRRLQRDTDLTIRVAERANTREHTVYVAADMSGLPGDTPQQKVATARRMVDAGTGAYAVQGYMVGSLDMGEAVNDGNDAEIVLEVKTCSGIYLGNSDGSTRDATHLVGRNRYLMPYAVQEGVPYLRSDGTTGTRTVIQMQDVTPDIWASVRAADRR